MSAEQTLESLKIEFTQWRQQKKSRGSRIPDDLREKALSLREHLKVSHIVNALGISGSTLQQWSKERKPQDTHSSNTKTETTFVTLPNEALLTTPPLITSPCNTAAPPVQLSCVSGEGLHWCLQGDINPEQINAFVTSLTCRGVMS